MKLTIGDGGEMMNEIEIKAVKVVEEIVSDEMDDSFILGLKLKILEEMKC